MAWAVTVAAVFFIRTEVARDHVWHFFLCSQSLGKNWIQRVMKKCD